MNRQVLTWINVVCASEVHSKYMAAISEQVSVASGGRLPSILTFLKSSRRTVESYERELIRYRSMEIRLRDALAYFH